MASNNRTFTVSWETNYLNEMAQLYGIDAEQSMVDILSEQITIDLDDSIINDFCKEYNVDGFCDIYYKRDLKKYRKRMENEYKFR